MSNCLYSFEKKCTAVRCCCQYFLTHIITRAYILYGLTVLYRRLYGKPIRFESVLRFLDDFKYAVVQLAFDTEPIPVKQLEYVIKNVPPVHGTYDHRENDRRGEHDDIHNRCRAITDRYFLRDTDDQLSADVAAGNLFRNISTKLILRMNVHCFIFFLLFLSLYVL